MAGIWAAGVLTPLFFYRMERAKQLPLWPVVVMFLIGIYGILLSLLVYPNVLK